MPVFGGDMFTRVMQMRDKTRVALRKSACGVVLIDGLSFSISVESDGAANNSGVVMAIAGDAVIDDSFTIDMIEVTYPSGNGTKTIKRKPEYYERKTGGKILRLLCPEVKIPECDTPGSVLGVAKNQEQLEAGSKHQIIFRFTPHYKEKTEQEIMINIYPNASPLEGSVTEWLMATSDTEFFEHGGLKKIMGKKKRK
ncbi:MAG: hypothetical protein J6M17_05280 [Ruminococcus sp.]|nr:hypothetical protein [Ruminococcus sp.]